MSNQLRAKKPYKKRTGPPLIISDEHKVKMLHYVNEHRDVLYAKMTPAMPRHKINQAWEGLQNYASGFGVMFKSHGHVKKVVNGWSQQYSMKKLKASKTGQGAVVFTKADNLLEEIRHGSKDSSKATDVSFK